MGASIKNKLITATLGGDVIPSSGTTDFPPSGIGLSTTNPTAGTYNLDTAVCTVTSAKNLCYAYFSTRFTFANSGSTMQYNVQLMDGGRLVTETGVRTGGTHNGAHIVTLIANESNRPSTTTYTYRVVVTGTNNNNWFNYNLYDVENTRAFSVNANDTHVATAKRVNGLIHS